jgi:hypothetical protein
MADQEIVSRQPNVCFDSNTARVNGRAQGYFAPIIVVRMTSDRDHAVGAPMREDRVPAAGDMPGAQLTVKIVREEIDKKIPCEGAEFQYSPISYNVRSAIEP